MVRALCSVVAVAFVAAVAVFGVAGTAAADDVTLEITAVDENDRPLDGVDLSVTWDDGEGGPRTATTSADGRALVDVPEGSDVSIAVDDDEYVRNRPFRVFGVEGGTVSVPVSDPGRVTVVVEGPDGPVESATLEIRSPSSQVDAQTTNESGVARTDRLELGRYTVRVTAPGHLQREVRVEVTGVERTRTVTVQPADVGATVTVVDDGLQPPEPVDGATVRVAALDTTVTTGSDGRATLSVPVNRNYELRVEKNGYNAERVRVGVDEEALTREVALQREPSLSLESSNQQIVVGESTVVTVTDEYGRTVQGAVVSVDGETVGRTDERGEIRVPVESAGEVTVGASDGDATTATTVEGVDPSAGTPTTTPTPRASATATPGADGAGFGVVGAVLALLAAGLVGRS